MAWSDLVDYELAWSDPVDSFEDGVPIAANPAGTLSFEKAGDLFLIRVGDERFEVPEAVVTGG